VSRLTDLLGQLAESNPALADDLRREAAVLAARRQFGLNFERHVPETVEMYGRKVRRGDKVRLLPPRGKITASDKRTWVVVGFQGKGEARQALLVERADVDEPETRTHAVSELVVVADFHQPIYPGLRSTGKVERGGDKPSHLVINGENFHVLEALTFAHREAVDCIYIDPPYNTRDKDWKYNNDYVDSDDDYRHSKWLAMMERRLLLAKELLKPNDSVLIVTIDEKEYLRLGLLLEQTFDGARIQMISAQINPANVARRGGFGRNDEYIFFVMLGEAAPQRVLLGPDWFSARGRTFMGSVRWDLLRRSGTNARRVDRPKLFYPIFVNPQKPCVVGTGEPPADGEDRGAVVAPDDAVAVWPVRRDGSEGNWQLGPSALMKHVAEGRVRLGGSAEKGFVVYYIKGGEYEKVLRGDYPILGRNDDGSLKLGESDQSENLLIPGTQWRVASHDATQYGSRLLAKLVPGRPFPFPKSLYAVEDALRFFVKDKPNALILDFFAGSGTTAHAVMRLNRQDEGERRCICVTNNEVSAEEATALTKAGYRAGDPEWAALGICEHITKPRITAAVTGDNSESEPITGNYAFRDEFPMAEGFDENVEFFDLTYEDPERVRHGLGFEAIAPLLWLRAGSRGTRIESAMQDFQVVDSYGVLFNLDAAAPFVAAVAGQPNLKTAYIVTDDEAQFQVVAHQLPARTRAVRLYSAYLDNAKIVARD
jgi:adenine-specific DNA-methyltransferase